MTNEELISENESLKKRVDELEAQLGDLSKIKAEEVREAAEYSKTIYYAGNERACSYPELLIYANKLETTK